MTTIRTAEERFMRLISSVCLTSFSQFGEFRSLMDVLARMYHLVNGSFSIIWMQNRYPTIMLLALLLAFPFKHASLKTGSMLGYITLVWIIFLHQHTNICSNITLVIYYKPGLKKKKSEGFGSQKIHIIYLELFRNPRHKALTIFISICFCICIHSVLPCKPFWQAF